MEPIGALAVEESAKRALSFLGGHYELPSDIKGKLKTLGEILLKLQSVVELTEGKLIESPKMVQWLKEFKDIMYRADDLLDNFEYRYLKKKADDQTVSSFFASSFSSVNALADYIFLSRDEDVIELNNLVKRLEGMVSMISDLPTTSLTSDRQSSICWQRLTSSFPIFRHSFVGRVKEKEEIINILLRNEKYGATNVRVVPILGIGGIGKTTLAQFVYNDERVRSNFELKMWVCVSESFDVFRLTREMLELIDRGANYASVTNFSILQEILKEKLRPKKFLLVLDDVWNETEREVWETLKAPLFYGKRGSAILLTSRLPKVAKLMGTTNQIELEGLSEDECWSILKECAFGDVNLKHHPRLVALGKKIASKLKGSPLAVKTVGGMLKDNLDSDIWESISESNLWEYEKSQNGITAALKRSYLHLPTHLQQCFAFLSIIPKDWGYKREEVIRMWMAHGMIHHDGGRKRIEDIGEEYFNELISKSFFQSRDDEDHYAIHDLLYGIAEYVSKGNCMRIEGDVFLTIPIGIHHLSLNVKHLARLKEHVFVLNNLRTLILWSNFSVCPNDGDLQDVLIQLKSIRLLTLKNCYLKKCPANLSSLTHLRYLDLSSNVTINELPDELTKLYHLQTLNLFQLEFDRLPANMNKLISLRSLICSSRVLSMVAELGKMTSLQELMCPFYVQNISRFEIGQLKYLTELGGCLSIRNIQNVDSEEQAKEAKLCDKENLVQLVLHWGSLKKNNKSEEENRILECLRPNANLKKLHIDGYKGTQSPSWMNGFDNLVSLKLTDCQAWEDLPPIGQLTRLEVLELSEMHAIKTIGDGLLSEMHAIKTIGDGFHGSGFLSLRELVFDDLQEWEVWSAANEVNLFPCLQILRISECPKLTMIPPIPPNLQRLQLFNVGLSEFPKFPASLSSSSSLAILSIKGCPKLHSPGEWLQEQHKNLSHLEELCVDPCGELDHLIVEAINKLTRLKKLCIDSWPSEQNYEEDEEAREDMKYTEEAPKYKEYTSLLVESLESLEIINCVVADKILSNSIQSLFALQSLKLDWCSVTALSFGEGWKVLEGFSRLEITNCRELTSLVGFGSLCFVKNLTIVGCPKLIAFHWLVSDEMDMVVEEKVGLSALSTLSIDNTSLLKVLLSKEGLASLKQLEIIFSDQEEIKDEVVHPLRSLQSLRFEACHNLETLPALKNLHSLQTLEIEDCSNFLSLPRKQNLPPLLTNLSVRRCHPELKEKCDMYDIL